MIKKGPVMSPHHPIQDMTTSYLTEASLLVQQEVEINTRTSCALLNISDNNTRNYITMNMAHSSSFFKHFLFSCMDLGHLLSPSFVKDLICNIKTSEDKCQEICIRL